MEFLKKNKALIITLAILVVVSKIFYTKTETYKKERISYTKTIIKLNKENVKLKNKLKEVDLNKDIKEITITKKDGTKIKTKLTKINKRSKTKEKSIELTKTKQYIENSKIEHTKESKEIVINPKKLNIGIGIDTKLDEYMYMNYNFNSTFSIGTTIKKDSIGVQFGISF